jgi:inosine triphosphate pyrophosphatase|tara:strand:- start:6733 stop:7527 length:795 start_codon:yes stop_codon:yes gene_type:complete
MVKRGIPETKAKTAKVKRESKKARVDQGSMDTKTLHVLYCTGNAGKFREASHVFDAWNASEKGKLMRVAYVQVDADPVEIQGDCEAVAYAKVKKAMKILGNTGVLNEHRKRVGDDGILDVVTEDVSLHLGCLNGFPGPYCKPMLSAIGDGGLWTLVERYEDKSANVQCTLAACGLDLGLPYSSDIYYSTSTHVGTLDGTIGKPKGNVKHGATSWNSVFTPTGKTKTFGETPFAEQAKFSHRRTAIMDYLEQRLIDPDDNSGSGE